MICSSYYFARPYDLIIMDAYATTRYGSSVPPALTTKEFFAEASAHLTTNGLIAYNVIGQIQGWRSGFVAALYRTMNEVFPRVYLFPARESMNIVLIGTKSPELFDPARVRQEAEALTQSRLVRFPAFAVRLRSFSNIPPPRAAASLVLTDDHAPVESLLRDAAPGK